MKQLTGNQVRAMFLEYFESHGHKVEPSHSLIPDNDPTLLWINAGVAALKKYFDGSVKPENPRICNAQKSIRTNDIENVGKTARHHTFFEMLGNFSIGDYFKKEAIDFAWEFLTDAKWLGFEQDKLYITVHDKDEEAYNYWVNVKGIDPTHMLKTAGNFWEIGEGPCGPDSEIFYDRGDKYDPEGLGVKLFYEELENDRYIEIWNLVFSQYNAKEGVSRDEYKELPQKNIDTGMGLERLVSIIQGGETNFDTDFFLPIIEATAAKAKVSYQENKMAYRVIADHIRTVTFALSDGAMFDNAGRGYVLRRILRRAVRYGKQIGIEKAFMYQLVAIVADIMKDYYDYLENKVDFVAMLVEKEEMAFHKTLVHGEKLISEIIGANTSGTISGEDAFRLYDTYGFPFELTLEIAQENNLEVDESGFQEQLKIQKERSRNAREDMDSMKAQQADLMAFTAVSEFDYNNLCGQSEVVGLFVDGIKADKITTKGEVVLAKTPFYALMGGQCGDIGTMVNANVELEVTDVIKAPNGQHLHIVKVVKGELSLGDVVETQVDGKRRQSIAANHSATHILHQVLKDVLGDHVGQAGSFVDAYRLRFDFTHFSKIDSATLNQIEDKVNQIIMSGAHVVTKLMNKEEAVASGAMAMFDDKYGDEVRVVAIGDFSKELCGGTHVENSLNIGMFKLASEESVGSGIRRIEAVTGAEGYKAFKQEKLTVDAIAELLKLKNRDDVVSRVEATLDKLSATAKELEESQDKLNALKAKSLVGDTLNVNGVNVLLTNQALEGNQPKALALDLRDKLQSGVVILSNFDGAKAAYYVGVTKDLVAAGYQAGAIVKAINALTNGRGGGKPDFAQGGCQDEAALKLIETNLENIISK
ncbi:MAG: alanine--tRNA ligase [Erysipelotrichaceae bacterium]|nr:alanine--tRNA ligase [Erysipelotrichaceae bacterium]